MAKLRVMVTGSRNWTDYETIRRVIRDIPFLFEGRLKSDGTGRWDTVDLSEVIIVHGDARGADALCKRAAEHWGCELEPHPADWEGPNGLGAGLFRNQEMVDSEPDIVLAFRVGGIDSRGTTHAIQAAMKAGIRVIVYEWPSPHRVSNKEIVAVGRAGKV
jgi:hypothetical protein